jgi:hypothetical protein
MLPPGPTLTATVKRVLERMNASKPDYVNRRLDKLAIPQLNFDLDKNFTELENLQLVIEPDAKIKGPLVITEVKQLLRFQLNETGAKLKSEALIAVPAGAPETPAPTPQPHIMIFDQPFLILMKRANSATPYFALWVGNTSLLIPADKP